MDEQYRISLVEKAIALVKDIEDGRIADVVAILEAVSFDQDFCHYVADLASASLGDEDLMGDELSEEN